MSETHSKFFCYQCLVQLDNLTAESTCPRCSGDFIEEIEAANLDQQLRLDYRVERETFDPFRDMPELPPRGNLGFGRYSTSEADVETGQHGSTHICLSRATIEAMPTQIITKEILEANGRCTVCCHEFVLNETARRLICSHIFHPNCIFPWLKQKASCPICRKILITDPENEDEVSDDSSDDVPDLLL